MLYIMLFHVRRPCRCCTALATLQLKCMQSACPILLLAAKAARSKA